MAKKQNNILIKDWNGVNENLFELAKLTSHIQNMETDMNAELQKIREKYQQATAQDSLRASEHEAAIRDFCLKNKTEFDATRTRELAFGKLGFRYGKPKVALLNRKYNWDIVLELVKKLFGSKYVRPKEELNKEQILTDYAQRIITDENLASLGAKVDQDETFFIDLKWDEIGKEVV